MKHKFKNLSREDKIFYSVTYVLMTIFFIVVLYPCIYVLSASFSSGDAVQAGRVVLFPVDFSLDGYRTVFSYGQVWVGFRNSLFYTIMGTAINIIMTVAAAYCLSRNDLPGRDAIMLIYTFTMFFSGGIITSYILIKKLHILNTVWCILIPGAINVYNMIICKTFFQNSIPGDLLDASQIDGCSDIQYLIRIVLPLAKSAIAVQVLYYVVSHWNSYFSPMIYLTNQDLYPLTIFLKSILVQSQIDPSTIMDPELQDKITRIAGVMKYALIVVSTIPVLIIYPFIQKYFVKGVMIGSVKG
ncbi:MAG: carbohydrate ABC transporter permease [Lachnospiraceae bacterium]|nr:carbohydrate ABC transporter permease [Lachnospiraceae bacterium]